MPNDGSSKTPIVIVTGLSGAGKSTALGAFEDMGYEVVDNMPLALLARFMKTQDDNPEHANERPIGFGIDCRTRAFNADGVLAEIERLRARQGQDVTLLFLDCDDLELVRSFSETRRRHPLAIDRRVEDGIAKERELLGRLKAHADRLLDTTGQTIHQTRKRIRDSFTVEAPHGLQITVSSFSYAKGLPRDADLVMDVRFLRNPHYVDRLKPLTGKHEAVAAYVASDPDFAPFFDQLVTLTGLLLPRFKEEGKSYLTIAFGCTGGRHRSVFVAEFLAKVLEKDGYAVNIVHRDTEFEDSGEAKGSSRER